MDVRQYKLFFQEDRRNTAARLYDCYVDPNSNRLVTSSDDVAQGLHASARAEVGGAGHLREGRARGAQPDHRQHLPQVREGRRRRAVGDGHPAPTSRRTPAAAARSYDGAAAAAGCAVCRAHVCAARALRRAFMLCISGHQRFSVCGFSDSLNVKFAGECAVKGGGDQPEAGRWRGGRRRRARPGWAGVRRSWRAVRTWGGGSGGPAHVHESTTVVQWPC